MERCSFFSEAMKADANALIKYGAHGSPDSLATKRMRAKLDDFYDKSRNELIDQPEESVLNWLRKRYADAGLDFDEVRAAMEKYAAFPLLLSAKSFAVLDRYRRIVDAYVMRDAQELLDAMAGRYKNGDYLDRDEALISFKFGQLLMFSDLIGSATKNLVCGRPSGRGHEGEYYDFYTYRQEMESFANIVALDGEGERFWRKLLARFVPRMYKVYKEAVK